jgi:chromobox protein 5
MLSSYEPPNGKDYEVKAIIQHRKVKGGYEYLVRWKGYSAEHDSWEPTRNFNAKEVIDVYWKRRGSRTRRG